MWRGPADQLFEKDVLNAERRPCLPACGLDRVLEAIRGIDGPHSAAASSHRGLDHDRVTEFAG